MIRRWIDTLILCTAAAVLAGCSTGPRIVEGQVQSFSTLAAMPAPATYRLERLPSQQTPSFEPIAALAEQALARVGLTRDDAAPRLLVQIGVHADTVPRYDPYPAWGFGGWYGRGWGMQGAWRFGELPPLHRRAVSLMVRDAATLLRDVSEFTTLQAGDVLMLGTDCLPDGTRPRAKAGDRIEISAPGFAPLVNTLVEDPA